MNKFHGNAKVDNNSSSWEKKTPANMNCMLDVIARDADDVDDDDDIIHKFTWFIRHF